MGEDQETININPEQYGGTSETPQAQLEALRAANPGKTIVKLVRLGVSTSNVVLDPESRLQVILDYLRNAGESLDQLNTFVNNEEEDGEYILEDGDVVSLVKKYDNGNAGF